MSDSYPQQKDNQENIITPKERVLFGGKVNTLPPNLERDDWQARIAENPTGLTTLWDSRGRFKSETD